MFWLRPPFTDITEREAVNGVFSDVILAPSDFEEPHEALNDTSKGAPIVERLIVDVRFAQVVTNSYFFPAGLNQVTMLVEAMLFVQNDQFATLVTSSATFDTVLENQRILGYGLMDWNVDDTSDNATRFQIRCGIKFEPKSRVKIREQSLCIAIRTNFNIAASESISNFPSVGHTFLIKQP